MLLFLASSMTVSGQEQDSINRHHIAWGISGNGQISAVVKDFYFLSLAENNIRQTMVKINIEYSFKTRNNIEGGMIVGYGIKKDRYTEERIESQTYLSGLPYLVKSWNFMRFNIATGAGIPFYAISEFRFSGLDNAQKHFSYKVKGGIATGISSITRLRFSLTRQLSVFSTLNFGLLHIEMGGSFSQDPETAEVPAWFTNPQRKYKSTELSPPEISFGIGFTL